MMPEPFSYECRVPIVFWPRTVWAIQKPDGELLQAQNGAPFAQFVACPTLEDAFELLIRHVALSGDKLKHYTIVCLSKGGRP